MGKIYPLFFSLCWQRWNSLSQLNKGEADWLDEIRGVSSDSP